MTEAVSESSRARMAALIKGDRDALSLLLAEDLRYIHANGIRHGRAQYLEFTTGPMKFLEVWLEESYVKQLGAVAVVTGTLNQRVIRAGEAEPVFLRSWAIEIWRHTNAWRLTDFQSTRLPT